jgi:hypothetical protein
MVALHMNPFSPPISRPLWKPKFAQFIGPAGFFIEAARYFFIELAGDG